MNMEDYDEYGYGAYAQTTGSVSRMDDAWVPKQLLFGKVKMLEEHQWEEQKRWMDCVKKPLKLSIQQPFLIPNIKVPLRIVVSTTHWEAAVQSQADIKSWRQTVQGT